MNEVEKQVNKATLGVLQKQCEGQTPAEKLYVALQGFSGIQKEYGRDAYFSLMLQAATELIAENSSLTKSCGELETSLVKSLNLQKRLIQEEADYQAEVNSRLDAMDHQAATVTLPVVKAGDVQRAFIGKASDSTDPDSEIETLDHLQRTEGDPILKAKIGESLAVKMARRDRKGR